MSYIFILTLAVLAKVANLITIGTDLAQCYVVAAQFSNTCTSTSVAPTWAALPSATVTCTQRKCPDSATGTSCTWTRQLCVTCYQTGSVVYMRVQTNGMPDHCFYSPYPVKSQKVDFTVKFNPSTTSLTAKTFADQAIFDAQSCQLAKTNDANVPTNSGYTAMTSGQTGTINMDNTLGVALNGVLIHASSNSLNVDPYYPQTWSGATTISADLVDACLGHPEATTGIYHYHILPPCLVNKAALTTT